MRQWDFCLNISHSDIFTRMSLDPPPSQADYQALAEFRYRLRLFLRFSEEAAAKEGLSPRQHQALLSIHGCSGEEPGITIGMLAEKLQLRHHSVVGLVNRLEKDGLVTRHADTGDRRKVCVTVTEEGLLRLRHLSAIHRQELKRSAPVLRGLLQQIEKA